MYVMKPMDAGAIRRKENQMLKTAKLYEERLVPLILEH
jgi:hypothetical protein